MQATWWKADSMDGCQVSKRDVANICPLSTHRNTKRQIWLPVERTQIFSRADSQAKLLPSHQHHHHHNHNLHHHRHPPLSTQHAPVLNTLQIYESSFEGWLERRDGSVEKLNAAKYLRERPAESTNWIITHFYYYRCLKIDVKPQTS